MMTVLQASVPLLLYANTTYSPELAGAAAGFALGDSPPVTGVSPGGGVLDSVLLNVIEQLPMFVVSVIAGTAGDTVPVLVAAIVIVPEFPATADALVVPQTTNVYD